jgi:hypothetical protein
MWILGNCTESCVHPGVSNQAGFATCNDQCSAEFSGEADDTDDFYDPDGPDETDDECDNPFGPLC